MTPKQPFFWLSATSQKPLFIFSSLLAIVTMIGLQLIDGQLSSAPGRYGIIDFELAGNPETADQILAAWAGSRSILAGVSLGADFLFILLYTTAVALGCVLVVAHFSPSLQRVGFLLAWAQYGAGLLDIVENVALIRLLVNGPPAQSPWPLLARWCALPKFTIVLTGLLFIAVLFLWRRVNPQPSQTG